MRILYVSHSFPLPGQPLSNVGGMQRVATGLHDALRAHPGVELHSRVLETSWKGTPYRMPGYLAGLLAGLAGEVERERIDVVLFSSMVTASVATVRGAAARRAGAILAAIPVGRDVTLPTRGYQWLVPRIFRALDVVFPISRATAGECIERGLPESRMHVVPCGVDTDMFAPPADRAEARRELLATIGETVPDDTLILCSVGRHQERKGFQWFVDAVMPRLPENVLYLVTGEGPTTPAIRAAIERRGVGDRVRLLGQVNEDTLRALYRGGDLFVMPNIHVPGDIEGFGVVMLEAGMCGMPVLAAALEGISDVIAEGENGHLVPSQDAAAFADRIMSLRADRAALAAASESAARFTAATFSWAAVADRYVELLRARVGGRGRATARP
ncbi:MAG TPA: glycosyltransferase family 4 protein [Longimicrobium sp.]